MVLPGEEGLGKSLQIISPQRPLSIGWLSFGPSIGQHWLLNWDWEAMFKRQETSITRISAYPAALEGEGVGGRRRI